MLFGSCGQAQTQICICGCNLHLMHVPASYQDSISLLQLLSARFRASETRSALRERVKEDDT